MNNKFKWFATKLRIFRRFIVRWKMEEANPSYTV